MEGTLNITQFPALRSLNFNRNETPTQSCSMNFLYGTWSHKTEVKHKSQTCMETKKARLFKSKLGKNYMVEENDSSKKGRLFLIIPC